MPLPYFLTESNVQFLEKKKDAKLYFVQTNITNRLGSAEMANGQIEMTKLPTLSTANLPGLIVAI